jgi:hypothetical protein
LALSTGVATSHQGQLPLGTFVTGMQGERHSQPATCIATSHQLQLLLGAFVHGMLAAFMHGVQGEMPSQPHRHDCMINLLG